MTKHPGKIPYRLILRSFGAVMLGALVVFAFVSLLSSYGMAPEPAVTETKAAQSHIPFPENEQMLDALPDRLAREAQGLSDVEPAAGENAGPADLTEKMAP